jgi:hypothetical protein
VRTAAFDKQAIIDAANAAIKVLQTDLDDHSIRTKAYIAKHREDWLKVNRPALREARDKLTAALKTGKVIRASDVRPTGKRLDDLFYSNPADYMLDHQVRKPNYGSRKEIQATIDSYRGVVNLLEAFSGDSISFNQLSVMGIKRVAALFEAAAKNREQSA